MKKKYIYAFAALLMWGVSGCELMSDFDDTNQNPAATTEPILSALLTNVGAQLGGYASETRPSLYAQYFSETQYPEASLYSTPQLSFTGHYSGPLMDLQDIINRSESNNMTQVARILQQYIFWTVTDRWGDVPYSEALQGNPTPKYDSQEEIYKGMIATLEEAVNAMDNSPITGDVIYGGDVAAWKKAANSMRMMMALRLSLVYPDAGGYAASQFKAALNHPAGIITTNAENFDIDYPGGNFPSNWWSLYNGRNDFAESKTMTDLLATFGDTRQEAFGGAAHAEGNTETSNVGVPYGYKRETVTAFTDANTNWARVLRGDFRRQNSTVTLIGAADVTLARAEAADYGWTGEDLQALYIQGITQSFQMWGYTPSTSYFTQNGVALTAAAGTGANLKQIATQRYIAAYPNGLQAWSIWRKTGFPALTPAPDAVNSSKQIPTRYVYASSEYTTNEAAVKAAVANLPGGDTQDSKVWWDR
ncbi:SusD/RagB family nutrient-binding outer membrane lipoprotein [Pontibacter litorisediminis]|uniref:SusD/RagB family nutrient-binding outer membrane lipoprotein n=1 Tax=Pontibacter litorisediminis TaxID=1846260 RepID=UPI0023EDEEB3|nr:SusD/RagB family nutrient-binding outer membrane lipoprotein [Pontibacter litorisediminis]